jgi:hypothetical protein
VKIASVIAFAFAASFLASNANAQLPQTNPLSAEMAQAIGHAKQKSVVVFDFGVQTKN